MTWDRDARPKPLSVVRLEEDVRRLEAEVAELRESVLQLQDVVSRHLTEVEP